MPIMHPNQSQVITYPAPSGVSMSPDYVVTANGKPVFIHTAQVLNGGPASFGGFDFGGVVEIAIKTPRPTTSVKVLPTSWGINPVIERDTIHIRLDQPRNLTIEVGGFERALHLFANPLEQDVPSPNDPRVQYFGPGIHDVTTLSLVSDSTLYLAGGAILKCRLDEAEQPTNEKDWAGKKNYAHFLVAKDAKNVRICGRGILDMSGLPWHARTAIVAQKVEGLHIEGITLIDAPAWGLAIFQCRDVLIENIKQICHRLNSDGIDLCNTQQAVVRDCFLRNNDDEICVKTTDPAPAPESADILVERCVIWNERARGLGITSETRQNIRNVTFRDCDIIHDFSNQPEWLCCALAILVSDSGTMSNIVFEDIRIEHSANTLIYCWIGEDMWGHDAVRGVIDGVCFKNITHTGESRPLIRLEGFNEMNRIKNITLDNLQLCGESVGEAKPEIFFMNAFVDKIQFLDSRPQDTN